MVNTEPCGKCGRNRAVCPNCGGSTVTSIDPVSYPLTRELRREILDADDGDVIEFSSVCWSCPWSKHFEVTVDWTVSN